MKNVHYDVQEEPIVLSKGLLDLLLAQDNPSGLIALYCFYYYTAKWQKTNQLKATTAYVAKGLNCTETSVRKNKKVLIELNLIYDITDKDSEGKITGHFIKLNFIWGKIKVGKIMEESTLLKNESVENPTPNALSTNNLNALSNNIFVDSSKNQENLLKQTDKKISQNQFEKFWKFYPKKDGKGAAITSWNKLCIKKDCPTWKELIRALFAQMESERWKNPQFIPMASTWLNQSRWMDDPELMIVYKRESFKNNNSDDDYSYTTAPLPDHILKQQRANQRRAEND